MKSLVALVLSLLVSAAAFAQPQTAPAPSAGQDLPQYTTEQRWERAASQATAAFLGMIALGKQAGRTVDDTGKALVGVFGPGWSKTMGPVEMARAVRRNVLLWPKAEVTALELTPTVAKIRFNRPWMDTFGQSNDAYGVKAEDLERTLEVFQRAIAEERGMTMDAQREGNYITYTFKKK